MSKKRSIVSLFVVLLVLGGAASIFFGDLVTPQAQSCAPGQVCSGSSLESNLLLDPTCVTVSYDLSKRQVQ